ncbi:DUF4157 domain-containing protein [Streptomyces sp. NPDC090994]|uniref:eCIS core domain-containing protein n=1 Tax=Streptomyces sp. NPDC090994 TaxID=3365969 RepID=UPI0038273EE6
MTAQRMLNLQRLAGNAAVARAVGTADHAHEPTYGHTGVEEGGPADQRQLLEAAMAGPSRELPGSLLDEASAFYDNNALSATRLHDDPTAQRAVAAMGAHAMTVGTHVFMGPTARGRKDIIGHELGHVDKNLRGDRETGQNNGAGVTVTSPGQDSERTAEADGAAFAAGAAQAPSVLAQRAAVPGAGPAAPAVQRSARASGALRADPLSVVQRYGSSRPVRRRRVNVDNLPSYIVRPSYTMTKAKRGGEWSTATLGPNGYFGMGTDANSNLPSSINKARRTYSIAFKAGHLLNADFGGTGRDAANLTILTPTANRLHQSFDNPVKNAVYMLRRVYELMADMYLPVDRLDYGVSVSVRVSDTKWDAHSPGKYITTQLYCDAGVTGVNSVYDMLLDAHDDGMDATAVYAAIDEVQNYVDLANSSNIIPNTH